MGIGIHYGSLMVGTIGEQERMDSTVISDTVNASSRLENLNKIYGTHVIISGQAIDTFTKKDEFKIRYLDHIRVKGKSQSIKLYEVFDGDPFELIEKKLKTHPIYQTAIQYFQEQEFAKALDVSLATVARWESGKTKVENALPHTFKKLCDLVEARELL